MKKQVRIILFTTLGAISICSLCMMLTIGYNVTFWAYQKYYVTNQIEKYKFPDSTIIESDVTISRGMTGNNCHITATTTFYANVPFEDVQQWYKEDSRGLSFYTNDRALDLLAQDKQNQRITYKVKYLKNVGSFLCPEGSS